MALYPMQRLTRPVPLPLVLQALFGGFLNQFGWFFFGFGMVFFWVFFMHSEAVTSWKFYGQLASVPGEITGSHETGSTEGGDDNTPGTPIYAIEYRYTLPDGKVLTGCSYQLGYAPEPDAAVIVEYNAANPQYSRIQGMRSAPFAGWISLIVLLFPLVGFVLLSIGLRRGLRALYVMRHGVPAIADLAEIRKTNVEVNNRPVYAMVFSFTCPRGQTYTSEVHTVNPDVYGVETPPETVHKFAHIDESQARQDMAIVLYHPGNPAISFVPEEFGPQIRVDERGVIYGHRPLVGIFSMLVPMLVVVGHGMYIFFRFLR